MRIAAVGRALPPHYYDQDTLLEALRQRWGGKFFNPERLERLHRNVLLCAVSEGSCPDHGGAQGCVS